MEFFKTTFIKFFKFCKNSMSKRIFTKFYFSLFKSSFILVLLHFQFGSSLDQFSSSLNVGHILP